MLEGLKEFFSNLANVPVFLIQKRRWMVRFTCSLAQLVKSRLGYWLLVKGLLVFLIVPSMGKEPGEVALDFLVKVREGKIDMEPGGDTALTPHTTDRKRELIEGFIDKLAVQIGEGRLELGETREDGEFAAVMVLQKSDLDESKLQVFPVALVKTGEDWRAAPILASFENSVVAYTVSLRSRLAALESWMMRQRVLDLEQLIAGSEQRLKEQVKEEMKTRNLVKSTPSEILKAFQKAFESGQKLEVMGYLGGLSEPLPNEWGIMVDAVREAFSEKAREVYPWRLLAAPEVVRVVVYEETAEDEAIISLACLDPAWVDGTDLWESIHVLHFEFHRDPQGRWSLDLPESLIRNDMNAFFTSQGMDDDLLDQFPKSIRKLWPEKAASEFEQLEKDVLEKLKFGSLEELLQWVDFSGDSKSAREAAVQAASDWWTMHSPEEFRAPVKLGEKKAGDWAVVAYQWFSINQPERFNLKSLYFKKSARGWLWVPNPAKKLAKKDSEVFSKWQEENQKTWRDGWDEKYFAQVLKLKSVPLVEQAGDKEARTFVEAWVKALSDRNIDVLLEKSASLGENKQLPNKTLRNLTYELAALQAGEVEIAGIFRSGKWVAAGMTLRKEKEQKSTFMPIFVTSEGIKSLPEIDLIAGGTRTRKFLNEASFKRLEGFVDEGDLDVLKELFVQFEEQIE